MEGSEVPKRKMRRGEDKEEGSGYVMGICGSWGRMSCITLSCLTS